MAKKIIGMREKTHNSVDTVRDSAENARDSGKDVIVSVEAKMIQAKRTVDDYIKKNPERSVLISLGVGTVVGAIGASTFLHGTKSLNNEKNS